LSDYKVLVNIVKLILGGREIATVRLILLERITSLSPLFQLCMENGEEQRGSGGAARSVMG